MKPLKSIDGGPSKSKDFLAGFVGTILILAIIFSVPLVAVLISLSGFVPYQTAFFIVPVMFTLGGIQLLYRLVKAKRSWALLGVGIGFLLILFFWLLTGILFHIYP